MKLRNIWFSFFQGMLKSSFVGGDWGVPLRGGLSASKSSQGCGLSAAIPNVGERGFTFWIHSSEYGLFPPQRPLPTTPAGCMVGSGRRGGKDKRNTFAHAVPPELRLFAETFRAPSRSKEFPRCLSGSRLTVLSFPNRYHFLSGLCRDCTDHTLVCGTYRPFSATSLARPSASRIA